jgi:hypothetical protein
MAAARPRCPAAAAARRQRVLAPEVSAIHCPCASASGIVAPSGCSSATKKTSVDLGWKTRRNELDVVVGSRDEVRVEEREADLVAVQ